MVQVLVRKATHLGHKVVGGVGALHGLPPGLPHAEGGRAHAPLTCQPDTACFIPFNIPMQGSGSSP